MALGDLVRTIFVRIREDGADQVKAAIDDVAARAEALKALNPELSVRIDAAAATAKMAAIRAELKATAAGANDAGNAWKFNVTGMQAAVAAGVALSPVLITVGTGLAGLAIAALGVSKNTALMAQVMAPLKLDLAAFDQALQPQVLAVFNEGVALAGHLLHDIQPVAAATGAALASMLGAIDKEFASSAWQGFFHFMASTAAPDIQLLTGLFTSLLADIPPLAQSLQPLAVALLQAATAAAKLFGSLEQVHLALPALGVALGAVAFGPLGAIAGGALGAALEYTRLHTSVVHVNPALLENAGALRMIASELGATFGPALGRAVAGMDSTAKAAQAMAGQARPAAESLQALATAIKNLMTAQANAVNAQLAYGDAILTAANDAAALEKALDASHGKVGLLTGAQRNSLGAAQAYMHSLVDVATQAYNSGHGIDAAIAAIRRGLPMLDAAKGKTAEYRTEVQALITWLDKLRAMANITKYINIVTTYTGASSAFAYRRGPGYQTGTGWATPGLHVVHAGEMIFGGGEQVVPAAQAAALAPAAAGRPVTVNLILSGNDQSLMTAFAKNIRVMGGDPAILQRKVKFA